MATLKPKVTLKTKGEEAYVSVKQLMVSLQWTASVDLDLMAFYKTKDGRDGGIFSDNYAGGRYGQLEHLSFYPTQRRCRSWRYRRSNEEVIRITQLDDMAEVYICTINLLMPARNKNRVSASTTRKSRLLMIKGKMCPASGFSQSGVVAVIAKIDNSGFMGAKLVNENRI
jgi:hypothetical protein